MVKEVYNNSLNGEFYVDSINEFDKQCILGFFGEVLFYNAVQRHTELRLMRVKYDAHILHKYPLYTRRDGIVIYNLSFFEYSKNKLFKANGNRLYEAIRLWKTLKIKSPDTRIFLICTILDNKAQHAVYTKDEFESDLDQVMKEIKRNIENG